MLNLANYNHPAHLVGHSPYPLMMSCHVYFLCTGLLMWFKYGDYFYLPCGLLCMVGVALLWGKDICMEGLAGNHNFIVQSGLLYSFLLFMFSELMFFISIFWVFFDASVSPSIEIGCVWPPYGIVPPNYLGVPLFGTVVLLGSGVTVSWSHAQLLSNMKASYTLFFTIALASFFLFLQVYEYFHLSFDISDGIYGSIFYFSTGFHGLHVLIGGLYLLYNLFRLNLMHFSSTHHVGFIAAILYWHFVDIIWVALYLCVYWWGS